MNDLFLLSVGAWPQLLWPAYLLNQLQPLSLSITFTILTAHPDHIDVLSCIKQITSSTNNNDLHQPDVTQKRVPDKLVPFQLELINRLGLRVASLASNTSNSSTSTSGESSSARLSPFDLFTPMSQNVLVHYILLPLPSTSKTTAAGTRNLRHQMDRTYDEAIHTTDFSSPSTSSTNSSSNPALSCDPTRIQEYWYRPAHQVCPFVMHEPEVTDNVLLNTAVLQAIHASVRWAIPDDRRFWWKDFMNKVAEDGSSTDGIVVKQDGNSASSCSSTNSSGTAILSSTPHLDEFNNQQKHETLFENLELNNALEPAISEWIAATMSSENLPSSSTSTLPDEGIDTLIPPAWNPSWGRHITSVPTETLASLPAPPPRSAMIEYRIPGYGPVPAWALHRYVRLGSDRVVIPIESVRFGPEILRVGDLVRLKSRRQIVNSHRSNNGLNINPDNTVLLGEATVPSNTNNSSTASSSTASLSDTIHDYSSYVYQAGSSAQELFEIDTMVFCSLHGSETLPAGSGHRSASVKVYGRLWKRLCRPGGDALYRFVSRVDRSYGLTVDDSLITPNNNTSSTPTSSSSMRPVYKSLCKSYSSQLSKWSALQQGDNDEEGDGEDVAEVVVEENTIIETRARNPVEYNDADEEDGDVDVNDDNDEEYDEIIDIVNTSSLGGRKSTSSRRPSNRNSTSQLRAGSTSSSNSSRKSSTKPSKYSHYSKSPAAAAAAAGDQQQSTSKTSSTKSASTASKSAMFASQIDSLPWTVARQYWWQLTGETRVVDLRTDIAGKYYAAYPYLDASLKMTELGAWDPCGVEESDNVVMKGYGGLNSKNAEAGGLYGSTSTSNSDTCADNLLKRNYQDRSHINHQPHSAKSLYALIRLLRKKELVIERRRDKNELWSSDEEEEEEQEGGEVECDEGQGNGEGCVYVKQQQSNVNGMMDGMSLLEKDAANLLSSFSHNQLPTTYHTAAASVTTSSSSSTITPMQMDDDENDALANLISFSLVKGDPAIMM